MPWNPDGTRKKPSSYTMKYQGNTSAFPFKSPIHDHEKDSDGNIIKHSDITTVNQPHTKEKSEKIEREKGILEDRISLTAAQNKAITKQRNLHKAGKINTKQLNEAIAEIKTYVDY